MYAQSAFRMDDPAETAAFIEAHRFATLVVAGADGPVSAHIPMLVERGADGGVIALAGHVARGNPVGDIALGGGKALAIFHGPAAYVSPSLYPSKREHGKVAPTWNYMAVQARGALSGFTDPARLRAHLDALTDTMERGLPEPWAVGDAPEEYVARLIAGVTGVRLAMESVEGVRKLSQNRPEADRASVIAAFAASADPAAQALAREMSLIKEA